MNSFSVRLQFVFGLLSFFLFFVFFLQKSKTRANRCPNMRKKVAMAWPYTTKRSWKHLTTGLELELTGKKKEGTSKTDLEKELTRWTKQHKYELGRSQDICQGQEKMEERCGGPMLLKEPRGLSQVSQVIVETVKELCEPLKQVYWHWLEKPIN